MNSMFTLNKHDVLSFEHLLPSDVISQSNEATVAQLIDKRIQKLSRECFDVESYNEQIEQWFMEKDKLKETVEDNVDKKEDEKQEEEEKRETTQKDDIKESEKESKEETIPKTDSIETDTDKNHEIESSEKKAIASKYPDLENIEDPFTKYALIMFHAMISSLDLAQHLNILCADSDLDSEHYGVISKYIENLHAIFSSMTTHEIRSGLKGKTDSDFGVLSHIKQFVIECIASKTKRKRKKQLIWQQLFEILIKLSIGNTNVSSLLQCIWYLLTLIDDENSIKFNLKSTMKYIANLRMLNIAENNKKYINSTVFGFGKCSEGRIGCKLHLNEQLISEPRNIDTLNGANICKLATFSSHCLALTNNGNVYSWGSSKNLGYGTNASSLPRLIEMKQVITDISCGMAHSLLITANGYVYSFGHGTNGRLGHNDETHRNTPTLIKSLVQQNKLITSGHCGSTFNLLIDDNGNLYSFGKNNVAQCGLNNTSDAILTPTAITMTDKCIVVHAAAGWDHALCCCSNGRIYSWGNGYEGARGVLGHGDKLMRCKPTQIEALKAEEVIHVCCGYDHSLCCTQDGDIYSWGWGQYGQLGCGSRKEQLSPVKLKTSNNCKFIQLAAGENHTLCLDERGACYSFGHCQEYQTGHGLQQSSSSVVIEPKAIHAKYFKDIPIRYIAAGDKFSLILTAKMEKNESNEAYDDENSSVQNESGLNELKSSFVVVKLLNSNASLESNDSLEAIQVITHIISVIDRSCKYIVPSSEQFWSGNDKKHSKNVEPFTFELTIDTFVLLNDILQCSVDKIQQHLTQHCSLPKQQDWDGWLWWILASILRILKAHFHVLSNRDDLDIFQTASDTQLLANIHSTILNLLHGRTFKYVADAHDNKTRIRILDLRRESGEVLICGLHVFHKNPNDRLTLLKSILIEENELIEDDQILPFGRSLKEGLLQVFAQQIASQQIQSFTNNELFDDWLIVLDSVMQTIHKHMNKKVIYTKKKRDSDSEQETKSTSMDLVKYNVAFCKCGEELQQMDYKKCYSGAGVNCDFCAVSIIKNVWHCAKAKESAIHPNGFDLCGHCTKLPMIEEQYMDIAHADEDKTQKAQQHNDNKEKEIIETISFEGEDINERCPPRHPLIAAFQSTLSSSLSSKKTEHLKAMESYTNILFKHSEKVISDLHDKYIEIKDEILNDDTLNEEDKKSECQRMRGAIDELIETSLMGEGGLWYWLHILHVLAIYPFFTEKTFTSALNIIQLLYEMRDKPDIRDAKRVLPFEKICNLLTSLCVRLTLYQWKHYDVYRLQEKEEKKENKDKKEKKKDKLIKLRVGCNRIKALQKLLTLLECEHSVQSYIILLNTTRTTISLATLFHELHYLEGLDLDKVSDEHKEELAQLFAKVIQRITILCVDKGLLLSPIGPQLTNVLIPVLIDSEYELLHQNNIIELIADHIKYILQYKMSKDLSFKQQFKYKPQEDEKESKLQYNIPLDENEHIVLDKIQRGLIHALTYLVNQLHRDNASKLRFIRKQNKEKDKENVHKSKTRTFCKAEELVLTKLMDLFYERIHICCDALSSRHAIKPSVCTLMERTHAMNTGKKQKKSRFKSSQFLNTNIDQLLNEPIYILRKEMSLGDKSPNRSYIDTTKDNLLIQGRYQLLSKANKLQVNKCQDANKNKNNNIAKKDSSHITLCTAFDPPSDAYNFSLSFWIKPRDTKLMRCAWGKQLIYRGKKGQMHPAILFVGSHPSISVSFTVKDKNKTNIVELLCPLPAKANECFNKWWHIVVTLKDNQICMIVNGDYVRETTFTGTISAPITQFYNVGKLATKPAKTQIEADAAQKMICQHIFDGHIRNLAHYFIPLTKSEIMDIYLRKFEIKNNALDAFHLFGYKSLHLLTTLMSNHALIAPFFCIMDGYHDNEDNEAITDQEDVAQETKETDEVLQNDERKAISTYDSAKWFNMLFKVFKYGGFKLRREVIAVFRMIFKNKHCKINLKHLSFALKVDSTHRVLDEIMNAIVCSVWTKEYALHSMIQSEVTSVPLKQLMENDKDAEYGLNDKEAKTIYSSYITTYKASNLIEADIDSNVSTMFACHLLQLLWDIDSNKSIIDSYITTQLKLRLDDTKKERSKAPKKTYAQSIASKPLTTADSNTKVIKSSHDKTETVKFIAVLYLLNGSILRLLPHQMAFDSNRSINLPQLTLNRGYICRLMISTNNAVFRSEISGPQHLSLDSLIPIPYLSSCFITDSSDECFNTIIKGTTIAISKLFTRFYNADASTSNQQLIVSRVTIMMINALCHALDPMFNSLTSAKKVFERIAANTHFSTLCNKILSLSKNIIPSEIKLDANDILPTQIKWDTAMLDMGYLEKYVQILQSYLWTNKSKESTIKSTTAKHKGKSKKKSSKKQDKDNKLKKGKTYNWPSGPSNCTEAKSVQYIFKEYRGKKKALICELCRDQALGASTTYHDIWKHFMIRHYDLLNKHINLNKLFKTLRDKLDGGGDGADGDNASVDPRFKNLNQEYVQNLAMMGFPIEWCQFALAECNNDIAAASDWLLNHLDNIDEIMRQREEQRMQEKQKKLSDKKRKAAQFMMEYQMQHDEIKDYAQRFKYNDYLDVFTPINIVKKANNNNVYDTISNNNSYSINDFGTKYTARPAYRRFELAHLLSRITEKYTFIQISTLLARAQFYLATMYARKLIALLLYHAHDTKTTQTQQVSETVDTTTEEEEEEEVNDAPSPTTATATTSCDSLSDIDALPSALPVIISLSSTSPTNTAANSVETPPVCGSFDSRQDEKEEKEQKEQKEEKESKMDDTANEKDEKTECKKKRDRKIKIDIDEFGSIPLVAFMDHMSKKNPAHLMHVVLNMIHLLTFRGDLFHDFKRSKHKLDDPLHYNVVTENIRLFIHQNLVCGNAAENITHKRLSRHFAQNLTKLCVDHLKLLLLKSKQLDNIKWGERLISFRDEQVLSHSLLLDHFKTHFSKSYSKSTAKKKSKKSKKEKKANKEKEKHNKKEQASKPTDAEYVCLERVAMILNELFATNSVEIYTPSVYNILWDSFMLTPNIYVKSMAFKFLSHLEANWAEFASDPLKESKPKLMTLTIYNRLKAMFDKLYILEKRSENDHFSVLLNSLSQFLSRINWIQQMEESKENDDDDTVHDVHHIIDNVVYEKHREWTTYKVSECVSSGAAYWTLQINSSRQPTMICVGVVRKDFDTTKCIGSSDNSIGLLGDGSLWRFGHMISSQFTSNKQFEAGTKIGIYLNLNRGELMFTMNGSEANENDIKQKIDAECAKMILPQSISSMICGIPQSTPTLVSSNNNTNNSLYSNILKNRIIKLNINNDSVWYPAVSLYSQKDAIRLIKDQCYVSSLHDARLPSILPSPVPKCDDFTNIIRTVIALNKNDLELIPNEVMQNASKWLLSWIQNEKRFCRFGAFGYDVAIESAELKKHSVEVGDLVSFSSKVCRVMGEFRGRIILKNEANPNQEHLYCVEWKEFDKKIKMNQSTKSNKFKRRYDLEMKTDSNLTAAFDVFEETVIDVENGIFEATIQSLSKADLVEINKEITNIWKIKGKTAFDLTINDFIEHKIAKNNIICGFALIRYINKYIHWLFPLFNPSLFYSFFNEQLVQFSDLMFCHLRMSLILHLLTDDVEHGNSSRVKSIHLNLLNEKHSIFEQLSSKINTNAPMDTIYRSVIPDRYGQLRIFMPSFAFCGNNKMNDGDEGGQYRQLFSMIMKELLQSTKSEKNTALFSHLQIEKKQKKHHHLLFKKELDVLKLFETLGRIIGLSVRSLLNVNIDAIPDWFWTALWYNNNNNNNNNNNTIDAHMNINTECMMSIRKGLFFVLPKQLRYLLDAKQFKLLLCGECPQYDLSAFSIKQLMLKQTQTTSALRETFVINKTLIQNRIVLLLERSAAYMEPLTRSTAHIDMFWRVLFSLSKMELFQFIQFLSGHNIWPLYITSHSNVSPTNIYSNYVQSNANHNKKLPISSINVSADVLYDVEYINFLIKSYYLYGSIMHNKSNQIHNDQINYLWIIDQCHITFCNQTPKMKAAPDKYLPEVHTCTCSIRLPSYSSESILKTKLLKAIELCDTFDALQTAFPINKIVQKRSRTFKSNITQKLQDLFK